MRQQGSKSTMRGVAPPTTVAGESLADRAQDLLDRNFTALAPNEKWVADFTYVNAGAASHTSHSSRTFQPSERGRASPTRPPIHSADSSRVPSRRQVSRTPTAGAATNLEPSRAGEFGGCGARVYLAAEQAVLVMVAGGCANTLLDEAHVARRKLLAHTDALGEAPG